MEQRTYHSADKHNYINYQALLFKMTLISLLSGRREIQLSWWEALSLTVVTIFFLVRRCLNDCCLITLELILCISNHYSRKGSNFLISCRLETMSCYNIYVTRCAQCSLAKENVFLFFSRMFFILFPVVCTSVYQAMLEANKYISDTENFVLFLKLDFWYRKLLWKLINISTSHIFWLPL